MLKSLLLIVLVLSVQGASIKREELLKALKRLLSKPTRTTVGPNAANTREFITGGMDTAESFLLTYYEDLFHTNVDELTDATRIAEALEAVRGVMMPSSDTIEPCIQLAQLIGAIRYAMTTYFMPGDYESLREVVDYAIMDWEGSADDVIAIDNVDLEHVQHALFEPLWETLVQLECELGLAQCGNNIIPGVEDMEHSPAEMLYWKLHERFSTVDVETMSVGDILLKFVGVVQEWLDDVDTITCTADTVRLGVESLGNAIHTVQQNMASFETLHNVLVATLGINPSETDKLELVDHITSVLYSDHFVDRYLALQWLKRVLGRELSPAVIELNAQIISLMYWMGVADSLGDKIWNELEEIIPHDIMMGPVGNIDADTTVTGVYLILESIYKNWNTGCLNARVLGAVAGVIEAQKFVATTMHPGVSRIVETVRNQLNISIIDPRLQGTLRGVTDVVVREFDNITESIHTTVGRQPTEVIFIELERALAEVNSYTVHDLLEVALKTIVPLLGHEHVNGSTFKCNVTMEEAKAIIRQAVDLRIRIGNLTLNGTLKTAVVDILRNNFRNVSGVELGPLAEKIIMQVHVVLKDVLESMDKLRATDDEYEMRHGILEFLAINYGLFVHHKLGNAAGGPRVPHPPVIPIEPGEIPDTGNPALDVILWQQSLITEFIAKYTLGMSRIAATRPFVHSDDPCEVMPDLCHMIENLAGTLGHIEYRKR